jgi:hypothetical protein
MSSTQPPQNAPSVPGLSGAGLGNPTTGAPTVSPPNQQDFKVPGQDAIASSIDAANQPIKLDQSAQQDTRAQQQALLGTMQKQSAGNGPSAAALQAQTSIEASGAASASAGNAYRGSNELAASKAQGDAQAGMNSQTAAAGAAGAANEQVAAQQNESQLLGSIASGDIAGSSQRMQADIASKNIQSQTVQNKMALSAMQLRGSEDFSRATVAFQERRQTEYIQAQAQQMANMRILWGAVLQTAGAAASAYLSSPGVLEAGPQDVTNDVYDVSSPEVDSTAGAGDTNSNVG